MRFLTHAPASCLRNRGGRRGSANRAAVPKRRLLRGWQRTHAPQRPTDKRCAVSGRGPSLNSSAVPAAEAGLNGPTAPRNLPAVVAVAICATCPSPCSRASACFRVQGLPSATCALHSALRASALPHVPSTPLQSLRTCQRAFRWAAPGQAVGANLIVRCLRLRRRHAAAAHGDAPAAVAARCRGGRRGGRLRLQGEHPHPRTPPSQPRPYIERGWLPQGS